MRGRLYLLLLPAFFFVTFFYVYPITQLFWLSLTKWDGFTPPVYIGLKNYYYLFNDPVFYIALKNNFTWAIIFLIANNGLALFLAGTIDIMRPRVGQFFRIVLYLSSLTSIVVISTLFRAVYEYNIGLLNTILRSIGLKPIGWLSDPNLALYSILASSIWQYASWPMLIFLSAFAGISPAILEAAKIDGANEWQIFWKIKLPCIWPVILAILVLTWIWNSQPFAQVWTMTFGGPGHATEVLATYLYRLAFSGMELGYASALSVILLLMIFPVGILLVKVFER
jgi:raffinose/stachyose/melibiose transport system permease protein